jgi:NDP-sugar pyrophosphorylase family protein
LDKANSVASALREINDSNVKLKEDFIIMAGDVVTNGRLQDAIKMHIGAKKSKGKGDDGASVIMTKIFAQIPYSNPVRDPSQELALLLD